MNIVAIVFLLTVLTDPPLVMWILGVIGIGGSSVGIISEIRRAKRAAADPWGISPQAGNALPPGGGRG
ncbi:hypothetical protein ABLG96_09550 [Nakamurella sp. A5-74]|uniref:Uncharacterized protein n=1 Tax=Nakamurella sp. A5-74 TaxID=3158264 RepID=A0AAU8DVS8_9ACTN